ncbi:MAG: amidohydrolase family protein [Roseibacillus sp.]|nr:amidohydrolase family protein [Roseibacillus sp.]
MKMCPLLTILLPLAVATASAQVAVQAELLYPMTGDLRPIEDGVVLCAKDGKIEKVGPAGAVAIPDGYRVLKAKVVTPGFIDAHATIGLSGILNIDRHDQEQLDKSAPIQPELRAIDAYNGRDPLVEWIRQLGITTVHTGHAPGALVAGQTMILKTNVPTITDPEKNTLRPFSMVASTLGPDGFGGGGKAPGSRAKSLAMLRENLLKAQSHLKKRKKAKEDETPDPDLRLDALADVLEKKVPFLITARRHHDIAAALRLQKEFEFRLVLDGASEAYFLLDEIKEAEVPVLVHPTMARPYGENENMTFTLAAKLHAAGIPFAFQSGHEGYVPKTRVVHFEAALAVAYGLPWEQALAGCTAAAAELLGIADQVGSLRAGLDADLALFDGDPLETVTHCTGVIIDGVVVSGEVK